MTTASPATYEQILFEQRGRAGVVTLNRPEKLNAWTWQMAAELTEAITHCNDDSGIGAIVITGAGRGFCSGADISGFNQAIEARDSGSEQQPQRRRATVGFYQQSKPIIVAINGPAIGIGLTMTLPMDIRIASDRAKFSMRFVRMGITPEAQSTVYLPQIVGIANALELSLTARIIDADTALRYGLVSRVVPHDDLMTEALALADEIANNPTDAATAAKQLLHRSMVEQDLETVVGREGAVITKQYESAGHKEAIRSFIEKREPRFNQ